MPSAYARRVPHRTRARCLRALSRPLSGRQEKGGNMTRRKLIAGNWKMNGSLSALAELDSIAAAAAAAPGVDVAVAVPATLIAPAHARVPSLAIGAEDVHEADSGAHTGCISASMVKEAGAVFTIVAHSERR